MFDPSGKLTYLRYARRELSRAATVPVLDTAEADALATERFAAGCPGDKPITGLKLSRRLVYYAPSLAVGSVQQIVPHYDYGAQASIGGRTVELEHVLLPAVADGAPRPTLHATADGGRITADDDRQGRPGAVHVPLRVVHHDAVRQGGRPAAPRPPTPSSPGPAEARRGASRSA